MILNWYIFYFLAVEVLKSVMQKLSLAFIISHQGSFLRVMIALAQMVVLMLEDLNSILRIFGTKQLNLISNTIKDQVLPIFHMARKKRSAKPQFNQQYNQGSSAFQVGSHSQGFDFFDNLRRPNVGGLGSRTQNKAGQIAVSRGSSATNIDYYKQIKS